MVITKREDVTKQGYSEDGLILVHIQCFFLGGGWGLFEAGRLSTFSAFRMGAYSRWVLIRGWVLIWLNTVTVNVVNNRIEKHIYQKTL